MLATDFLPLGLTVLGVISLLVSAVVAAFGARARIVATQQGLTIDALEGRLSAVESENRQLHQDTTNTQAIVVERDKRIASLQSEVATLRELFASAKAIEDLTVEVRTSRADILKAVTAA